MKTRFWILGLLFTAPSWASFQTDISAARSSSLGGAVTASGDGAADMFQMPAALAAVSAPETSLAYGKPFSGVAGEDFGIGALALALPSQWGTWGAGFSAFRAVGALEETTFYFGYGAGLFDGRIRAGLTIKRMDVRFLIADDLSAQGDPIFSNGKSRSAIDADAGLSAALPGSLRVGIAVRNLRRSDVGLLERDRLRREVRGGLALDLSALGLTVEGDAVSRSKADGSTGNLAPAVGIEKQFLRETPFFLRAGANRDRYSAGLGLRRGRLGLDYAFLMPRTSSGSETSAHHIQMTFQFASRER